MVSLYNVCYLLIASGMFTGFYKDCLSSILRIEGKSETFVCLASPSKSQSVQSVQLLSRVRLCDPVNCSTPGLPAHHKLMEYSDSCPSSQWCHPVISSSVIPFSSCLHSFPASGSFPMSRFFTSGSQSIGVSASASVLTMNIQDWSPLGWTGWISLQSKGLSRVFPNTTVQKHQF